MTNLRTVPRLPSGVPVDALEVEALLQDLREPIRLAATVRIRCAAAGDYAALDVMSNSVTDGFGLPTFVPNLARSEGGVATIVGVRVTCNEDAVLNQLRLYFFNQAPTPAEVEMDDNIAFDIKTEAGLDKFAGSILLGAMVDRGTAGSTSDNSNLVEPLACAPGQTGLWLVLTSETAEANETANMQYRIDFYTM